MTIHRQIIKSDGSHLRRMIAVIRQDSFGGDILGNRRTLKALDVTQSLISSISMFP